VRYRTPESVKASPWVTGKRMFIPNMSSRKPT
jgi:hypothetical protein